MKMTDPFQNVDAAGPEFIQMFADAMDMRQSDPKMEEIVGNYLEFLDFSEESLTIEVGAGAGAVSRRVAFLAEPGRVLGYEPSLGFINEARKRALGYTNLTFEPADGEALPIESNSADHVIMHTVLTHAEHPERLIAEAKRVLKPGGKLVICDADFSKASLGNFPNDPLEACAREFVQHFVTDPYVVAKLRALIAEAGMNLLHFELDSRVAVEAEQMLAFATMSTSKMRERGDIGEELENALVAEYHRRAETGALYGYQCFATAIAERPFTA